MGRNREPLSGGLREISGHMRTVAAGQGGVITAAQGAAVGADPAVIRRLLGSGEWCRARRGVYRDTGFTARHLPAPASVLHGRCAALVAALGGRAVASHTTAARLLGLPLPPGAGHEVELTRGPPARSNRIGTAARVHVAEFCPAQVRGVCGVPVLAGARLVLDCCAALSPPDALAVADAALRRGLTTPSELRRELDRRRGRPGARAAAVVVRRADPLAESGLESVSRWWLAEAGLPRPVLQQPFTDRLGVVRARAAFWFPDARVVGEADGIERYRTPGDLYAEKRREDWLRDQHRVEVVRWAAAEMAGPRGRAEVLERFRRALDRQARAPDDGSGVPVHLDDGVLQLLRQQRDLPFPGPPLRSAAARSRSSGGDQHNRRNSSGCSRFSIGIVHCLATAPTPALAALSRAAAAGSRSAQRATGGGPSAGGEDNGSCPASSAAASATAAYQ